MNTGQEVTPSNQPIPGLSGPFSAVILPLVAAVSSEFLLRGFTLGTGDHLSSSAFGRMLAVFLSLYILHRFCYRTFRFYKPNFRNLLCISALVAVTVVVIWLGMLLSASLAGYISGRGESPISPDVFYYAIPFSFGALLLQSILGLQYGLVLTISLTLIAAVYFVPPLFALYVLATCLVACLSLSQFRSRSAFIKAGFNISLVSFALCLGDVLARYPLTSRAALFALLASLIGGIISAFLASGIAPVVEHLGDYVTDMRLIEMATIDHPLLKELSVQAPGTWNHCMVMGMMVEAACDAIGANPVLARVGAYFHDIGKIKKPLYFVENQGGEENRHDKLSSSMSALVIRTHVKDGIEMARRYGLPKAIEDMIPQHHGTSRIEYFYDKARKEAEEAGQDPNSVDESLYRYSGPKPQTREAGILMLADGIEAAARTLSDPSYDRILGMVQKMINKVFASGELNECDLTLKDLHIIARTFTRVLSGIYHQRIAYSEPAEKVRSEENIAGETDGEEIQKLTEPTQSEDLKRLGSEH